jgi:hypothetical protein
VAHTSGQGFTCSIRNIRITRSEAMVSFDVESLFTSVPVNEVLRITNNRLLSDTTLEDCTSIPIVDIMKLLELCVKNTYFQFRKTFYEQTEGLAMGSPLSPVLANIYMEHLALKTSHSPRFWKRYVDDTFAIIPSRSHSHFLQHLNSVRPGVIRFTHEIEKDGTLPFLDVLVSRTEVGIAFTANQQTPTNYSALTC